MMERKERFNEGLACPHVVRDQIADYFERMRNMPREVCFKDCINRICYAADCFTRAHPGESYYVKMQPFYYA